MLKINLFIIIFLFSTNSGLNYYLPINTVNRKSINGLTLTDIGEFGLLRKERPGIPAHYHTGIDIKRPTKNYQNELIFPLAAGIVISKREEGPYSQLIIEHEDNNDVLWTVYEHIAGIKVNLYEHVQPNSAIARFMNIDELNKYGWQFDHFHFEILKVPPFKLKTNNLNPDRHFSSYTLLCYTMKDLNKYFYNPLEFISAKI